MRQMLDVHEVAYMLGVKPRWVYDHAEELSVIRLGRLLRFRQDRVETWLRARGA